MMCLSADLSFSLLFNASHATQKIHRAVFARAEFPREMSERLRFPYRDCDSNPKIANLAAVFARSVAKPLVTRIPS